MSSIPTGARSKKVYQIYKVYRDTYLFYSYLSYFLFVVILGKKKTFKKGSTGVALTDNQRIQIQELEQRDADFDNQLDQIGEGIMDLAEIAEQQGEEVKRQSAMLDNVKYVLV